MAEDDFIKKSFSYDHSTGEITRIGSRSCDVSVIGVRADRARADGYMRISINKKYYQAHRIAWFLYYGTWPSRALDHVNGIRSDNRIANLREATPSQNAANTRPVGSLSKGVTLTKKGDRFRSQIKAVRKIHRCEQCNTDIAVGEPAHYAFGIWEGEPFGTYTHVECNAAANEYADMNDLWFEEYPWFQFMEDSEHDHHAWLLEKHPVVASRLNVRIQS